MVVSVAFLPASAERCCLDIEALLSTLALPASSVRITRAVDACTTALFWLPNRAQGNTADELAEILSMGSGVRFVQLPMTGVDDFLPLIRERTDIEWCCAKGCYADVVAEHAVALVLCLLRRLHVSAEGGMQTESLQGKRVVILGNGSIATALRRMLTPFGCTLTTANSTSPSQVQVAGAADVLVLACPLTNQTRGALDTSMLASMQPHAVLVNIARGEIIHTQALLTALERHTLAAAALDVINTEPLTPTDTLRLNTLVAKGKLLITPHSAVPAAQVHSLLTPRIRENLAHLLLPNPDYAGRVDPHKGY